MSDLLFGKRPKCCNQHVHVAACECLETGVPLFPTNVSPAERLEGIKLDAYSRAPDDLWVPYADRLEPESPKALDEQVGGNHYKNMSIQPVEFIHVNGIGFIEGCIIKYICRYKAKGGLEDLQKVRHYIDMLIELESA